MDIQQVGVGPLTRGKQPQPAAAFLLIGRDPGTAPGAHTNGYKQDNQDAQQRRGNTISRCVHLVGESAGVNRRPGLPGTPWPNP